MKPYKVKNDLWFYPVKSQKNPDFDGFYFQYPPMRPPSKFYPNNIQEDSPYYGFINSTIFCVTKEDMDKFINAGFSHAVNANDFKDDAWMLNGNIYEVVFKIIQQGWGSSLGNIFSLRYNGNDYFERLSNAPLSNAGMIICAPSIPEYNDGEIVRYYAYRDIIQSVSDYFTTNPLVNSYYALTSENYVKIWKDVVEAPPEIPRDTIRVYKDIYLQNGAKITEAEAGSEPLPPAHQVSGDLWVLPCRQILDDGTEVVSDIYYQYPFKDHRYYDYDNDPFEISDVSEYGDPTFSQCTVFTGSVKQYYGWNGLRLNSVKLRIKDTVVSLEGYSDRYSISLRMKRPMDTNYHMIAKYPNMQMTISGSTLFVKLSDTKIGNSTYYGMINNDDTVSNARLGKQEVTIPDDEESKDFYNWLFNDTYTTIPRLSGFKVYKNIILMNGAKIYNEDGTEYTI